MTADEDHRRLTTAASKAANITIAGMLVKEAVLDSELHTPKDWHKQKN